MSSDPRASVRWALILGLVAIAVGSPGKTLQTFDEAVAEIFPGAEVTRKELYLKEEQADAIEVRVGTRLPSRIYFSYVVEREGVPLATVYLEKHRVRSLPEVLMVAVGPGGEVVDVRVLVLVRRILALHANMQARKLERP